MNEKLNRLLTGLADVGCSKEKIKFAEKLYETGDTVQLKKFLKKCRCNLVDEMHESQQRVDRMDYLIRQTDKNNS